MRFEIKDKTGLTIWVNFDRDEILKQIAAYETLDIDRYPQATKQSSFKPSRVVNPENYLDEITRFERTVIQINARELTDRFNLLLSRKNNKTLIKNRIHGSWTCCPAVYLSPSYKLWQELEVYLKTTGEHTAEILFRAKPVESKF